MLVNLSGLVGYTGAHVLGNFSVTKQRGEQGTGFSAKLKDLVEDDLDPVPSRSGCCRDCNLLPESWCWIVLGPATGDGFPRLESDHGGGVRVLETLRRVTDLGYVQSTAGILGSMYCLVRYWLGVLMVLIRSW
jgi:hypothetical protein